MKVWGGESDALTSGMKVGGFESGALASGIKVAGGVASGALVSGILRGVNLAHTPQHQPHNPPPQLEDPQVSYLHLRLFSRGGLLFGGVCYLDLVHDMKFLLRRLRRKQFVALIHAPLSSSTS